jgi:hypothetical protein
MLYLPLFAPVIILAFIAAIWGTPPAAERARYNRSKGRWIAAIWHAVGLASGIHYFYLAGTEYVAGAAWLFGCYTYVGLIPVAVALPSSELAQRVKNGIALSFAGTVGGILLGAAGGWLAALLTNRPNDILWVGYGGIIGAALLATLGMWLAPQPSPNAVGRMAAGNQPRIWRSKTEDDVLEFLLDATKDEALARFLVEVTQKTGRDGYLVVERGGNGSPYEAEYQEEGQDGRTISEVQAELESRKQALALAQSDSGRDRIKRQIAELVGGTCTIRINVISSYEFNRQKALIIDTWAKFREIVGRPETGSALGT